MRIDALSFIALAPCATLRWAVRVAVLTSLLSDREPGVRESLAAFLVLRTFGEATAAPRDAFDEPELPPSLDLLAEHLAAGLERVVTRAIDGASHVAILTGGGVDSGALLAMVVAKARGANVKEVEAVALHFGGPGDDRPHLASLCHELGLTPIRTTPLDGVPFFAQSLRMGGRPDPWPTTAFELAMATRARDVGATRLLTGYGGDHMFNGEGRDLAFQVKQGHPIKAVREVLELQLPERPSALTKLRNYLVAPLVADYVPQWLRKPRRIQRQKQPWMGPKTLRFIEDYYSRAPNRSTRPTTPRARYLEWMASPWRTELEHRGEVLAREVSIGRRNPYLDPELLRVVARIPPRCMLADGVQKGLFRRAVARWVPQSLRVRKDKAWLEPALDVLVHHPSVEPELEALFDARELRGLGLVSDLFPKIVREETRASLSGWVHFWPALSAEAWLRGA